MSKNTAKTRRSNIWRGVAGGSLGGGTAGLIIFRYATFALKDDLRDTRDDIQDLRETVAQWVTALDDQHKAMSNRFRVRR